MNELDKMKAMIETIQYENVQKDSAEIKKGRYPFVTISRETGAGGNSVAAVILEELRKRGGFLWSGWQKFNQELCHKVAEDPKFKASLTSLLSSEYHSYVEDMLQELMLGSAPQDAANRKIFELIQTLAYHGKVIIVGRGGSWLTRHLPLGVHIRLVAPLEKRVQKMSEHLKQPAAKAKEYILEQDKAREKLLRTYFGKDIKDPCLYDMVWNTGAVPINVIASAVVDLMEVRVSLFKEKEYYPHEASAKNV